MNLKPLSDEKLRLNAQSLVKIERGVLIALLHHLREIEHRRLFSAWGYPSLFEYAIQELKYSESQAQRRISAMRLLRDVPESEEKIASGDLSLTNIGLAQAFFSKKRKDGEALSKEEKLEVLSGLENKSTRKAQEIIEEMDPEMAASKHELGFSYIQDDALRAKLLRIRGFYAHKHPSMSLTELLHKLCDEEIARMEKPVRPKKAPSAPKVNDEIIVGQPIHETGEAPADAPLSAAASDRYIRQRDHYKCTNCGSEYAIQTDHITPRTLGGSDSHENKRLLCRNCNLRAAIEVFGIDKMGPYLRERQVAYRI